jgi:ABC-2 type transport system permease protein
VSVALPADAAPAPAPGWVVVARQELRDLWLAGRGLPLLLAFTVLLSVITYLTAQNKALNFLEQHEAISLTVQVAVAVGALLALLVAADAFSGERERGTLEGLLLTPARRADLAAGKLLAAVSLWVAAFVVSVPYVWVLGHGVGAVGKPVAVAAVVGTLLAAGLTAFGVIVSTFARSNRLSLSVCLLVLIALFAPTQFPTGAQQGWAGELLQRVNPITAGEHYIGKLIVDGHPWSRDASWLVSPVAAAVLLVAAAIAIAPRHLTLQGSGWR